MITQSVKACMLRNNDKIIDVDGMMTVTDFKMHMMENIVTYTATKPDGKVSRRWADMDTYYEKVTG